MTAPGSAAPSPGAADPAPDPGAPLTIALGPPEHGVTRFAVDSARAAGTPVLEVEDVAGLPAALAGRVLGRRMESFGPLPPPLSRWTNARDVKMLPTESFRDWWARERGGKR